MSGFRGIFSSQESYVGRSSLSRHIHQKTKITSWSAWILPKKGAHPLLRGHITQHRHGGSDGSVKDRHMAKRARSSWLTARPQNMVLTSNPLLSTSVQVLITSPWSYVSSLLPALFAFQGSLPPPTLSTCNSSQKPPGAPLVPISPSQSFCKKKKFTAFYNMQVVLCDLLKIAKSYLCKSQEILCIKLYFSNPNSIHIDSK